MSFMDRPTACPVDEVEVQTHICHSPCLAPGALSMTLLAAVLHRGWGTRSGGARKGGWQAATPKTAYCQGSSTERHDNTTEPGAVLR